MKKLISTAIVQKALKFVRDQELLKNGDSIVVGFSGGPDSTFLIQFFLIIRNLFNLKIYAAHLNHKLRGKQSDEDEEFVKEFCKKNKIECLIETSDIKKIAQETKRSIEETARLERYRLFNEALQKFKANKIATGHTLNDNIETMIFNFIRGSGVSGLRGIPVKRDNIIRPLMGLTKEEILDFLKEENIPFRIDTTNFEEDYSRNFIRNKVIPLLLELNPNLYETLSYTSDLLRLLEKYIQTEETKFEKLFLTKKSEKFLRIKIESSIDYKNYLMMDLIRKKIDSVFNIQIGYEKTKEIINLIKQDKGTSIQINEKIIALRESNSILILVEPEFEEVNVTVTFDSKLQKYYGSYFEFKISSASVKEAKLSDNPLVEFFDADKIKHKLILRNWKPGDKFIPLGMKYSKKVSDILTDVKVPSIFKKQILVLCDGPEIIWLVGVRLSEKYKVTSETKKVIKARINYDFEI
ncbi:MAG: tRNA lysidine(34) synthetase TilS [Ignavibacteria bacterium]|jgi:tRNA(Ile)-lysidine synthase|nr:tRNA lysidine(34) synthetase TilS [Ignavibacteria bacterium]MDH7527040.1 tRNA lysidine(34) synthetase TilS [Ignavibacteria bacterium]